MYQDLDSAHVAYSYRHTTLVTLTVDGQNGQRGSPAPADTQEWHLPTFDPRNENKYMYRLHTLDIYFWTKEDALQFVNGIRRVLPQNRIAIEDEPVAPPAHADAMSPVVQQLENVAISDPSYQQGRTRDSRGYTGPPLSAVPGSQEASNFNPQVHQPTPVSQPPPPATFAPLAYNPAAPAAPEAIRHREKTPPPEDGAANPLMVAATSEHGQTYGVPFQQPGGYGGPPSHQPQPSGSYFPGLPGPPPPPQAQQPTPPSVQSPYAHHFQNQFAPPPTGNMPAPPAYKAQPSPHIPVNQFANYPSSPGIASGMTTPGIYSPGLTSPGLVSPGLQSPGFPAPGPYTPGVPPPPGGFAQYNYSQVSNTAPLMTDYSIHSQVYRPTEGEVAHKIKPTKPPAGKFEQRAGQVEKRVTGLFKKIEKKYG